MDPENFPLAYWWQISSNAEFTDTLATISAGTLNQLAIPVGTIAGIMDDAGVGLDESVTWHHRIVAVRRGGLRNGGCRGGYTHARKTSGR